MLKKGLRKFETYIDSTDLRISAESTEHILFYLCNHCSSIVRDIFSRVKRERWRSQCGNVHPGRDSFVLLFVLVVDGTPEYCRAALLQATEGMSRVTFLNVSYRQRNARIRSFFFYTFSQSSPRLCYSPGPDRVGY